MQLGDLALICRSKNAGPFELTLDLVLRSRTAFEHVARYLNADVIGKLYGVQTSDVLFTPLSAANAFKTTIPRICGAGDIGDTDVYGCQQHSPLLTFEIPQLLDAPSLYNQGDT